MNCNKKLIPDNLHKNIIYLEDTKEILCGLIIANEKGILKELLFNSNYNYNFNCYIHQNVEIEKIKLYQNGIVIHLKQNPSSICISDIETATSQLFILENEITYIISQIVLNSNQEYIINEKEQLEQFQKLGQEIKILTLDEEIRKELAKYPISRLWKKEEIINSIISRRIAISNKTDYYLPKIEETIRVKKSRKMVI